MFADVAPLRAKTLAHTPVVVPESELAPPVVSYEVETGRWRLEREYRYEEPGLGLRIPEGFEFDLASVPRPAWTLIAPFELSIAAPLVHDFLYRHRGRPPEGSVEPARTFSRGEVDALFRRMMKAEGVPGWRWRLADAAVRLFGGPAWGR